LDLDLPEKFIADNHQLLVVRAELAVDVLSEVCEHVFANLGCQLVLDRILGMSDDLLLNILNQRDAGSLLVDDRLVHSHGHGHG
jgi:hypothetical protein